MIQDGRRFSGPVELINHHKHNLDGFLTKPRIPCIRADGIVPMAWPGISMLELEQLVIEKALSRGLQVNKICLDYDIFFGLFSCSVFKFSDCCGCRLWSYLLTNNYSLSGWVKTYVSSHKEQSDKLYISQTVIVSNSQQVNVILK